MESWQFIQSPAGDWYWLCSNVISRQTRTSAATFKTRMECVANAMTSGYQKIAPSGGGNNAAPARQHQHRENRENKAAPPAGGQPTAKRAQRRNRNKSGKRNTKSNQTTS